MSDKKKILVIDDDPEMHLVLKYLLRDNEFIPLAAEDGETGLQMLADEQPDLVVLDLSMPRVNGWEVCERIREKSDIPIIILTAAHVTPADMVRGLELGANDYVTKPFDKRVLIARIRSALRWTAYANQVAFEDDHLHINLGERLVMRDGERLQLTKKEFDLLAALVSVSPRVVEHEELFEQVWDSSYTFDVNYVRIFVGHLRKKIEDDPAEPVYIHNERGVGYRFQKLPEHEQAANNSS